MAWKEPKILYYPKIIAPDLNIEEKPVFQNKYNAKTIYEWNIDGMVEYNITNDNGRNFNSNKKYDQDRIILDEQGREIRDAVATLIFPIFKHIIGNPSHLKDRNSDLLSNLKCKKLTDFKLYKDVFMTRVMQRSDNQQPFWKEKFLTRLLTLLGEKVRNQIRENYKGIIPYEKFTYGELISFTQKERLKICQDLKLRKQLKKERYQCINELRSFCHQFDIRNEPSASKTCYPVKPKNRKMNISEYYKNPNIEKYRKGNKQKKQKKIDKIIKCYRREKPGHISKYYELQIDELHTTSQSSVDENEPSINMLTKDQEFMIEVIDKIQDLELKREYLLKLKSSLEDKPKKENKNYF
uniref:Uncharacterized protein n=1 Tax=Gossypium raimondii TaxID=29730 RepID=A0A0D2RHG2_GOSRA|nr:hypothetical protein B456_003G060500 [Gossypium raimondii]